MRKVKNFKLLFRLMFNVPLYAMDNRLNEEKAASFKVISEVREIESILNEDIMNEYYRKIISAAYIVISEVRVKKSPSTEELEQVIKCKDAIKFILDSIGKYPKNGKTEKIDSSAVECYEACFFAETAIKRKCNLPILNERVNETAAFNVISEVREIESPSKYYLD